MLSLYLGALILGGGLLGFSLVMGGGDHDMDADTGMDVDADVDADHDFDVDGTHPFDVGDFLWLPFLSIRFWVFFLAFAGLVGTTLELLGTSGTTAMLAAGGMGLFAGYSVSLLMNALKRSQANSSIEPERDYVYRTGTVLLDVEPGQPGVVRLEVKGSSVDLDAVIDPDQAALRRGASVVVLSYEQGKVRVAPFDPSVSEWVEGVALRRGDGEPGAREAAG